MVFRANKSAIPAGINLATAHGLSPQYGVGMVAATGVISSRGLPLFHRCQSVEPLEFIGTASW